MAKTTKSTSTQNEAAASGSAGATASPKTVIIRIKITDPFVSWKDGQCTAEFFTNDPDVSVYQGTDDNGDPIEVIAIKKGAKVLQFQMDDPLIYSVGSVTFTQWKQADDMPDDPFGEVNFPIRTTQKGICQVKNTGHVHGPKGETLYKFSVTVQKNKDGIKEEGFVDPGIENQD